MIDTDNFEFMPARSFKLIPLAAGRRDVWWIVMHAMQAPELPTTATMIGKDFETTTESKSTHYGVDPDHIIQYVKDNNIAWGARGGNVNELAIHIEQAGYAEQTFKQWMDLPSRKILNNAAIVGAQVALKFDIPLIHLTDAQLKEGRKGFIGHDQVSRVFKVSGGHTDPGGAYPWMHFIRLVQAHAAARVLAFG